MKIKVNYVVFLYFFLISNAFIAQNINWTEDIAIYYHELSKKHINIFNKTAKNTFEKELNEIKKEAQNCDDFVTILNLMRLTRSIGDGHTAVSLRNINTHTFPFEIKFIDHKWRVIKVINQHKNILKSTLIAVDGIPIEQVSKKVAEVAQFVENQYSKVVRTGQYLTLSELLYALNITKNKKEARFTFLDDNNNETTISIRASEKDPFKSKDHFIEVNIGVNQITKPENSKFDYLWYAPIKDSKAVYVKFKSYPTFNEMQLFGEELLGFISKNTIEKVVIDMRDNGGGDLYVGIVLAYTLNLADSIDWENGVYVLTNHGTFSAGTSNATLFKKLLNAKIIGLPTGSNPTGFQDMGQFKLPNSKLVITFSKRYFKLVETKTEGLQPDVYIKYDWKPYSKGIDNILNSLIKQLTE